MDNQWPEQSDCDALADEVHVWSVPLGVDATRAAGLAVQLTEDERLRSGRFLRDEVRGRFIVGRVSLRFLLGGYLGVPAADVPIEIDGAGKPHLAASADMSGLKFNLAHSGDLALVAVARGCEVGVDVEQLRPVGHREELAARYFHPSEVAAIEGVDPSARDVAFLRCWTQKEAILKARGVGLSHSLQTFDVPIEESAGQWVDLPSVDGFAPRRYWLQSLRQLSDHVGAVATSQSKTIAFKKCPSIASVG